MRVFGALVITALAVGCALTGCSNQSVEQTTWVLDSFAGESMPVEALEDVTSEFTLADGTVTGSGGVNIFNGSYELSGEDISFGPLAATKMAGPPEAMEQESRFFEALESAAHVELKGNKMTLSDDDDAVLMLLVPAEQD